MQYHIVTRSQYRVGGSFGGPDRYMAVVGLPEGIQPTMPLRSDTFKRNGWTLHIIGEFYGEHTGLRSIYARHRAAAEAYIADLDKR